MNADEFFEKHSIEEINKKTKISPISLRFIKNKEFDKLPRVKFVGFVRIIEKKYKVDLSELINEYENYFNQNDNLSKEKEEIEDKKQEIKEKKSYLWILILFLFILSIFLYIEFFIKNNKNNQLINEMNITSISNNSVKSNEKFESFEKNSFKKSNENNVSDNLNYKIKENSFKQSGLKEYNITIYPNELVWFKAINIDTNKTKEYLTSKVKILKGNYYIKFGHGNITIMYNDKNITPNTKKIVRILFKNGKYKFLKKPNKYEK